MTTPFRPRHPRVVGALLGALAVLAIVLACESPAPDALAPNPPSANDGSSALVMNIVPEPPAAPGGITGDTVIFIAYCDKPGGSRQCTTVGGGSDLSEARVSELLAQATDSLAVKVRQGGFVMQGMVTAGHPLVVTDTTTRVTVEPDGRTHRQTQITTTGVKLPGDGWTFHPLTTNPRAAGGRARGGR